jgi:hypothetical protein
MRKLLKARVIRGYRVRLEFEDGTRGVVDLRPLLAGPAFEAVRDPSAFRKLKVQHGTLAWPGDADLSPEALYVAAAMHPTRDSDPAAAAPVELQREHVVVFHRPDGHETVYTFEREADAADMTSWLEKLGVPAKRISRFRRVNTADLAHAGA